MQYFLPVLLLLIANIFMTLAWYGHLKLNQMGISSNWPLIAVILFSWGIALIEYIFQVPANKMGFIGNGGPFTFLRDCKHSVSRRKGCMESLGSFRLSHYGSSFRILEKLTDFYTKKREICYCKFPFFYSFIAKLFNFVFCNLIYLVIQYIITFLFFLGI